MKKKVWRVKMEYETLSKQDLDMNNYWTMPLEQLRDLIYNIAPVRQCGRSLDRLGVSVVYLCRVSRLKKIRIKRVGIRDRKKYRRYLINRNK